MASSISDPRDGGYVTAVGASLAFVLALAATAVVGRAGSELTRARADLQRVQDAYRLDGLQTAAMVAVLADGQARRLRWRMTATGAGATVTAEAESAKVALSAAPEGLDPLLTRLTGGIDERLRARLRAASLAGPHARNRLEAVDDAPAWRGCVLSLVSPYGAAARWSPVKTHAPVGGGEFNWRVGEIWRLRVVSSDGLSDDRVVRFTGDALNPAAVIDRDLVRNAIETYPCERLTDSPA